jgi:hypothetical protein
VTGPYTRQHVSAYWINLFKAKLTFLAVGVFGLTAIVIPVVCFGTKVLVKVHVKAKKSRCVEAVRGWRYEVVVCESGFGQKRRGEIARYQAWKRAVKVRVSADW